MVGGPKAKCMKNISRFKLEGAFKEMGNAFRNSPEIFAGIAGPQLGTSPLHLSMGSYFLHGLLIFLLQCMQILMIRFSRLRFL